MRTGPFPLCLLALALISEQTAALGSAGAESAAQGRAGTGRPRLLSRPPSSPGPHQIFAQPVLRERQTGGRSVRAQAEAIVAREVFLVPGARMATEAAIEVAEPVRASFPAGTAVLLRTGDEGQSRCLLMARPLRDARRAVYPDACLIDRDQDRRFETLRLHPEEGRGTPLGLAISPVALRDLPAEQDERLIWFLAERRLRIAEIEDNRAKVVVESMIMPGGAPGPGWGTLAPQPAYQAILRLRQGATARLAGLTLRAVPDGAGGWLVATSGEFSPWLVLRDRNTLIDTGSGTMQTQ